MRRVLIETESAIIYEDGTYKCRHWDEDEVSQWKIEDDKFFYYKHQPHHDWNIGGGGFVNRENVVVLITNKLIEREIFGD